VRGSANIEAVTASPAACRWPRTDHLPRDDNDLVVFCFVKPEDAQAFAERFGGEVVPK
jgi:hypothetical protein